MRRTPSTKTLLLFAGLLAWGSIAQPFLSGLFRQPESLHEASVLARIAAHAAYLASFGWCVARGEGLALRNRVLLLAVQSIATFLLVHLRGVWLEAGLLAIVAAEASLLLPRAIALGWVGASTLAIIPFYVERADVAQALFWTTGVLGFQLFASAVGTMVKHEAEARAELGRVNAELRATQVMLAESARTAERLRIARELHDAVGHHLTALSINLEVARHAAPADEALERAHGLAKSMLGEVRAVVRAMREERALDLPRAIEELARGVPRPRVHVDIAEGLAPGDEVLAHALFRCVQEAITNAARHASADNLWITLSQGPAGLVLVARDDGRGSARVELGSGLAGVQERLAALGGEMTIETAPGEGLTLRAVVPTRGGVS